MKFRGKIIIWPCYLDSTKSRKMGRKLPLKYCVKSPSLGEVYEAARRLGLDPVKEEGKSHPACWWEKTGRILVTKKASKLAVLKQIAEEVRKIRSQSKRLK